MGFATESAPLCLGCGVSIREPATRARELTALAVVLAAWLALDENV